MSDEADEGEERGSAMLRVLSVVELLRPPLPDRVQYVLEEDFCLHEADLWNMLAGPIVRRGLLVNTQCSGTADGARFFLRPVAWCDCFPRDTPLLARY